LQINDTLFVKDNDFVKKEQASLKKAKFLAKERERLTFNNDFKFNERVIHVNDISITLIQVRQYKNLKIINNKNITTINNKGVIRQNLIIKD
jgi:hypothetical protein